MPSGTEIPGFSMRMNRQVGLLWRERPAWVGGRRMRQPWQLIGAYEPGKAPGRSDGGRHCGQVPFLWSALAWGKPRAGSARWLGNSLKLGS